MLPRRSFLALVLLLAGCASAADNLRSLTILHTNDLHARFLPDADQQGGFAYLATAIQQEKAKAEATLLLNGGDFVQGTPVSTIFQGVPVFEVVNHLGYDVNTLGNHEFDYGWRKILEFLSVAKFPTVSANVTDEQGNLLTKQPYVIREVNGIRLAIIGALTADLPKLTFKDFRGPWTALPVAETVRKYARQVRDKVDLVVVLSHIFDYEEDQILRDVPEVNVIISGHNHGGQQEVKNVEGRIGVKVRAYGRELGRLDLRVDVPGKRVASYEWKRIPIDARQIPADATVTKLVAEWEAKVAERVDVPVGSSRRRISPPELKPMIEQIMQQAAGADIAYMNRGGIRDALPEGRILARHVWNIMPFDNRLAVGRFLGKQLPEEAAAGRTLDPEKEYRVVTNDFIADQWREFGLEFPENGPLIRDLIIEWIKQKKVIE
jgi:2',3'-cyclic-nucleotide 2'-phosphodiesterase (5'-nucleotidase family)